MTQIDLRVAAKVDSRHLADPRRHASAAHSSARRLWMVATSHRRPDHGVGRSSGGQGRNVPPRKPLPPGFSTEAFTVSAAHAALLGEGRLRGPDLRRPFHGVRMPQHQPLSMEERCHAYRTRMRDCEVFTHRTAAALHGLPLPFGRDGRLDVSAFAPHGLPRAAGVRGHRISPGSITVVTVRGLPTASALDAWCQLAPELTLRQLVQVGDALVRRQHPLASTTELVAAVERRTGRRGGRLLRAAVELVREGVDSPAETELRLDLVEFGLPEPVVNLPILDASGDLIAIGDLAYPRFRVLVEYDGDHHRGDPAQYARDVDRLDDLAHAGWRVIRFNRSHRGIGRRARLERVRQALLAAGWVPDAAR